MNAGELEKIQEKLRSDPVEGLIFAGIIGSAAKRFRRMSNQPDGWDDMHIAIEVMSSVPKEETAGFQFLFKVDELGLWFNDGDGGDGLDGNPIWRPCLIPWSGVKWFRLHLAS